LRRRRQRSRQHRRERGVVPDLRGGPVRLRVRSRGCVATRWALHEPSLGRQVLDCASPLALWLPAGRIESARGLAQSKTLTRGRRFMVPMRVPRQVEALHERPEGFEAFTDGLVLISERFESSGNSRGRVHGFKARSWTSRNSHPGPLSLGEGDRTSGEGRYSNLGPRLLTGQ